MIWACAPCPGTSDLSAICRDAGELAEVQTQSDQGVLRFDGQAATVLYTDGLFVRFQLAEPFRMPPLVLRFEDEEIAEKIAATGFCTFEGKPYAATLRVAGELLLDQLFPTEPPPQYHGRWAGIGVACPA